MEYYECADTYECQECYQCVPYSQAREEICFNAYSLLRHIRTTDPRTAAHLISLYMRARHASDDEVYNREMVQSYYRDLMSDSLIGEKLLFQDYPLA